MVNVCRRHRPRRIEDGEISECGDHDNLLAQRGRYWQLYTAGAA
jgi:ABC-type multidrug transport system fused ATPase/permease subunit